jgi:4-hydroxy-3-polyprenylbenzoate decarboxylase
LPEGYGDPRVCLPGILAVRAAAWAAHDAEKFCRSFGPDEAINRFPLVVLVDDSEFTARCLKNFLWVTFTRSNPAADIDGIGAFTRQKHWGCEGSLVIDARRKPHHAPPLEEDPAISRRVDALAAPGGPLYGLI